MVRYLAIKVGGAIVLALASATGHTLATAQIINIGYKWWPLIGFGFFLVMMIWVFVDLYKANSRLLNARPSIIVEPYRFLLRVRNLGASAKFKANIEIVQYPMSVEPYAGYWQKSRSYETEIIKGDFDYIVVGNVKNHNDFQLCYYNFFSKSLQERAWWIADENSQKPPVPQCVLEIIITSNPELPTLTSERYECDLDGLRFVETVKLN